METTTNEQLLISKIVEDKTLTPVTEAGITPEYFADITSRKVFQALLRYRDEYGEVPTVRMLRKSYPRFPFVEVPEPFDHLIQEVQTSHHLHLIEDALADAVVIFDEREQAEQRKALDNITQLLQATLNDMARSTPHMHTINLTENTDERWEYYRGLKNRSDALLGIPSGFPRLDKALQGFQPGQLLVFAGPPKAGKSTMMLLSALAAHRLSKRPLLIGFEMTNEEQESRLDAITAAVSHARLRDGSLTEEEWKKLKQRLNTWKNEADFLLSNDTMSLTTLSAVGAKAEKHNPDLLIVDGVYMMQDENGEKPGSPQALTNITRGFKRLAQNLKIPIIITTQVLEWKMDKKAGVTANSVGYSSSFQQDADALIAVENTEDPKVKKIKIVIARNSPPQEIYVRWDWDNGDFYELPEDYLAPDDQEFAGAGF